MKYYVYYVENCSPKLVAFKTKVARTKFVKKFNALYEVNESINSGSWIDFSFDSEKIVTYNDTIIADGVFDPNV